MNLKQYLKDYNLSQTNFAKMLGCTPNYVNMMCRRVVAPGMLMAKEISRMTCGKVTIGELMDVPKKEEKQHKVA